MIVIGLIIAGGAIMCLLCHAAKNASLPKRPEPEKPVYFFSSTDKDYKGFDWESQCSNQADTRI